MSEEVIRVRLQDDTSGPATVAAESLQKLLAKLGDLERSEAGAAATEHLNELSAAAKRGGNDAVAALEQLRAAADDAAAAAHGAMAAWKEGGGAAAGVDQLVQSIQAAEQAAKRLKTAEEAAAQAAKKAADAAAESAQKIAEAARQKQAFNADKNEAMAFDRQMASANVLPAHLRTGQAPTQMSGFAALTGLVGKLFGANAAQGLVQGAGLLSNASEKLGPYMPMLQAGGTVLMGAGKLLAIGAVAMVAAGAALAAAIGAVVTKLLYAGAQLSIAMTGAKESFVAPLGAVLKDAQAAKDAYKAAIRVAVDLSLDKDETLKRAKELAGVGFRGAQIELVLRAVADVKGLGDEKGNAFQKVLEKLKNGKALTEEIVNGLRDEAGINSDLVYKKLAEALGTSIDDVKLKLKSGAIDVSKGIQAILAAAKEQTGGAAGAKAMGLPELAQSVKTLLESLFDSVDLTPAKEALQSLKKLLDGREGEQLKAAVTKLFGTLFKVIFGAFQGVEGEARLTRFITGATKAMEGAAMILERSGPQIISIIDALSKLVDRNGSTTGGSWLLSIAEGLGALANPVNTLLSGLASLLGFDLSSFGASLYQMGADMITGLVNGIMSGSAGVVQALVSTVNAAIAAANKALGRASPARATIEMGSDTSEGFEIGTLKRLRNVQSAGQQMAAAVLGGAQGAANDNGAVAAPAAAGGAGAYTLNIHVHMHGQTSREAAAAGTAAADAAYQQFVKHMGRFVRDGKAAA